MSDALRGATAPFLGTTPDPTPAPAVSEEPREWIFRSRWPNQIHRQGSIAVYFEDHFFRTSDPETIDFMCRVAKDEERTKGVVVWLRPQTAAPASEQPAARTRKRAK